MAKSKEAKQAKKAAAKELKKEKQLLKACKKKAKESESTTGEVDILTLLSHYEAKARTQEKAVGKLVNSSQPSPRAMSTLTALPSGDFLMFGGEFYEGSKVEVFNQTYRWTVDRDEWRLVECPVSPKPRCSHQAAFFKESVYMFGGEFSTVDQFYHFRDLWRFDLKTNTWEEVKCTGIGPSARSGHRMVVYKNQLVVFGGFHDTVRETRYFNDVHVLCLQTLKWTRITMPSQAHAPSPRSGALMAAYPQGNGIFVSGGYCKIKDTKKGAQGKSFSDSWWLNMTQVNADISSKTPSTRIWEKLGRRAALPSPRAGMSMVTHKALAVCFGGVTDEDEGGTSLRSVFYNDVLGFDLERKRWHVLNLKNASKTAGKGARRKGKRSGTDPEQLSGQDSCVPLADDADEDSDANIFDEEDLDETTFGYIDQAGKLVRIKLESYRGDDYTVSPSEGSPVAEGKESRSDAQAGQDKVTSPSGKEVALKFKEAQSEAAKRVDMPSNNASTPAGGDAVAGEQQRFVSRNQRSVSHGAAGTPSLLLEPDFETPLPRFNPTLAMKDNELLVYGGLMELGHKELTLDDCWALHLNIRTKWKCVLKGHLDEHPWNEQEDEPDDEQDDETDGSSSDDDSDFTHDSDSFSEDSDSERSQDVSVEPMKDDQKTLSRNGTKGVTEPAAQPKQHRSCMTIRDRMNSIRAKLQAGDHSNQLPQPNETLRDFFDRTKHYWMAHVEMHETGSVCGSHPDNKESRRGGFAIASAHYQRVAPLLRKLQRCEERQQENENGSRHD